MKRLRSWDRKLWGVTLLDSDLRGVLGTGWHNIKPDAYPGEPTRPLLFQTRAAARTWCAQREAGYRDKYPEYHICRAWRFRPVRVRERITTVTSHE